MQTNNAHKYTDEQLQAAIDEAFPQSGLIRYANIETRPGTSYWHQEAPNRLAIARAFLAALPKPEAAEIAALKAALAESEKQFQDKVDEIAHLLDKRDKAQGILKACLSVMPFGNIETHTAENLPGRISDLASEIASLSLENERLETELAALRTPILADDGRSLGEMASEAYHEAYGVGIVEKWQRAAQAVAAVVLAQAVRRMEAVPVEELWYAYEAANTSYGGMGAVRDRLIAAAKGEGQAQAKPSTRIEITEIPDKQPGPVGTLAYAPQAEEPAWIPHDGGPCPLKDEEVEEWEYKVRDGSIYKFNPPSERYWKHEDFPSDIIAYRVLKWKPGFGPEAKAQPATFEAHGKTWTRHTPGDPMPCDGGRRVFCISNSPDCYDGAMEAKCWSWGVEKVSIIGWRYADEPSQAEAVPAEEKKTTITGPSDKMLPPLDEAAPIGHCAVAAAYVHQKLDHLGVPRKRHGKTFTLWGRVEEYAANKAKPEPAQPWTPKPGDVVRLNSGGPEMTVEAYNADIDAACSWFDAAGFNQRFFPAACLTPAKEGQP